MDGWRLRPLVLVVVFPFLLLFLVIGRGKTMMCHLAVPQSTLSPAGPWGPFGTPFFPAAFSATSCIARRTAPRAVPSLSVTAFALMTALLDHADLYGALPTGLRVGGLPHKAQQASPQAHYYWSILLTMGVGTMCAHHTYITKPSFKALCGHNPGRRRQQHYTKPGIPALQKGDVFSW